MAAFRVAGMTALSHLSKLLFGLLLMKQLAIVQGPVGMGLLGNFMSLVTMVATFSGGGIVAGVVKYLSEYTGQVVRQQQFMQHAFLYTLMSAMMMGVCGVLVVPTVVSVIFPVPNHPVFYYYLWSLCGVQFCMAFNNFVFGVTNGLGRNSTYACIVVLGNGLAMGIAYIGIHYYGMTGAVMAIMAPFIFPLLPVLVYGLRYHTQVSVIVFRRVCWTTCLSDMRLLSRYSLMLLTSAICFPLTEMIIRDHMIAVMGIAATGLWQAVIKLSVVYLNFFALFLSFYVLPVFSATQDTVRIRRVMYQVTGAIIGCFVGMFCVYQWIQTPLITMVLSPDFLVIRPWVFLQMVGDLFRVLSWIVGVLFVAKAKIAWYIAGEIIQSVLFIIISFYCLSYNAQVSAVIAAYLVTYILYALGLWGIMGYQWRGV